MRVWLVNKVEDNESPQISESGSPSSERHAPECNTHGLRRRRKKLWCASAKKDGTTDLQDEILGKARRADSGLVGWIRQILAKCQERVASAAYPRSSFHQQMEVLEAGARLKDQATFLHSIVYGNNITNQLAAHIDLPRVLDDLLDVR